MNAGCHENFWAEFPTPLPNGAPNPIRIFHWELDHPRRFVTPIKARGKLGLWEADESLTYLMEIAEIEP